MIRRLFRRRPDQLVLALSQRVEELESRMHHLEVTNRNLLARVVATEGDLAWILKPDEQPLPAPTALPESVIYQKGASSLEQPVTIPKPLDPGRVGR